MKVEACGVGSLRVSGSGPVEVGSRQSRGGLPDMPHHHAQSLPTPPPPSLMTPHPPAPIVRIPHPASRILHPASRFPRARFCAQSITSTSSHPPRSPVNPVASLPIVWMVRPRPAEVGHSPQAPQVLSPNPCSRRPGVSGQWFPIFQDGYRHPRKVKTQHGCNQDQSLWAEP